MKKKTKIILAIILVVLIGGCFAAIRIYKNIESNLEKLCAMPIENVDLTKVSDGTYTGTFKAFPVSAEVKVTVKDHVITGIELVKHDTGKGKPAEIIPERVVEAQSLDVDAVSGATFSSKVILKAIENAFDKAGE